MEAKPFASSIFTAMLLAACGGGSSSTTTNQGTLTIGITDAPADNAEQVWVRFTGITLKPAGGEQIVFPFQDPLDIDLASLTDGNSVALLNDAEVDAGAYEWIRFDVDAELDGNFEYSYVVTNDGGSMGMEDLSVPSDRMRLVTGFVVTESQNTNFMIDVDLRKWLTNPVGQDGWFLRPALRMVDMTEYGSIRGTVDPALTMDDVDEPEETQCANDAMTDAGNVVYVYEGFDVGPTDIDTTDDDDMPNVDPITTANATMDPETNGLLSYTVPFLSPGDYTVAFTCQGLNEDPEAADGLVLVGAANVEVIDGEDTFHDFE